MSYRGDTISEAQHRPYRASACRASASATSVVAATSHEQLRQPAQELDHGQHGDVSVLLGMLPAVHGNSGLNDTVLEEFAKRVAILAAPARAAFTSTPTARPGAVQTKSTSTPAGVRYTPDSPRRPVGQVGADLVQDPGFECSAAFAVVKGFAQAPGGGPRHAAVEQIELRVRTLADLEPRLPGRQPGADERVHEHVEVALDGGPGHRGLAGDVGDVHHLAVDQRRDAEESGKRPEVPRERLLLNLLAR